MFWPKVLLQLLHGTSLAAAAVHADASAMRDDFAQVCPQANVQYTDDS